MKPLFTELELRTAKSKDKLPCECFYCSSIFYLTKLRIQRANNKNQTAQGKYCSRKCQFAAQITKQKLHCKKCGTEFERWIKDIKRAKNQFCSKSCAATYNNTHKTHGTRRSKLEKYIENKLSLLYPGLIIYFNSKEIINSELDIYIPYLNIAFELNGIYHYKAIHGNDKFIQIQNNDYEKETRCKKIGIGLYSIDTSQMNKFNEKDAKVILNKIVARIGIEPISQD
jgi:hypothetical protein